MFSSNLSEDNSSRAFAAPIIIASMLIPAVAIGNNPTAVKKEYLPPTSSGTINVS
ncbi:Uncharacterised protein [Staphylococcus aureus]|nr:Uncharacterised protein [Staphylococcus aureus]